VTCSSESTKRANGGVRLSHRHWHEEQEHDLLSSPSSDIRVAVTAYHGLQGVDEAGHVDVRVSSSPGPYLGT
jgi:hypothetical protein